MAATVLAVVLAGVSTGAALESDAALDHEEVSDLVADAIGDEQELIEPTPRANVLDATSEAEGIGVSLPVDGGDVALVDQESGDAVEIGLPIEVPVDSTDVAGDGTVVYSASDSEASEREAVDLAAQVVDDGSVRISTVISGPDAPHEFTYPLALPEGTKLTVLEDGSIIGVDGGGDFVVGVQAPWAKDASGADVRTSYHIEGHSIIQTVDVIEDADYPVVADPYFGKKLIAYTAWAKYLWKWSPTLRVYPTSFGRNAYWGAPPAARWAAWKELLDKAPRKGWPNPNTSSMKNQFYCHFDLVRFKEPNKAYWGLDSKIPNRGYTGFVRKGCN